MLPAVLNESTILNVKLDTSAVIAVRAFIAADQYEADLT